jgi:hypothetical protein
VNRSKAVVAARLIASAVITAFVLPATALAQTFPLPWPAPGSPPLPPDLTVPYLPSVDPVRCKDGSFSCWTQLENELIARTSALGCHHGVIFSDAYVTITQALKAATAAGVWARPDRVTHEAKNYAQEYFDNRDRWYAGDTAHVAPSWQIAFAAADRQEVTALGNVLLDLNAHIRRDNPIRAVEQTEGVLRLPGPMPAASGRTDHDRISDVLQDTLEPMLDHIAAHYDPTIDDSADLFGMVIDQKGIYALISTWREESWRNAEQLRRARAFGGINGPLYRAKLAQIEEAARLGAEAIRAGTLTTPEQNAARNAFCAAAH